MNKIMRDTSGYYVELEDGTTIACERWYEKKTDKWHVKLPKDNPTGRQYIREDKVLPELDKNGYYEFEDKTTGPRVMNGKGWRDYLTDDEKVELEEAEKTIEAIKVKCMERKSQPMSEEDKLRHQIELLQARLNKVVG